MENLQIDIANNEEEGENYESIEEYFLDCCRFGFLFLIVFYNLKYDLGMLQK
jgi:hypothetical protein